MLKPRLDSAKRLAAGGACVAFGTDAGMLPHHENWREFPVMASVRFTRLRALRAPQAEPPNCSITAT
jgi:imidazolonepropionase-like amidohydrolase